MIYPYPGTCFGSVTPFTLRRLCDACWPRCDPVKNDYKCYPPSGRSVRKTHVLLGNEELYRSVWFTHEDGESAENKGK